jgi:hypothetical protein
MVSLAQMVPTEGEQSVAWKALCIFICGSISANLVAAGCAIWATIYLAWMPLGVALEDEDEQTKLESAYKPYRGSEDTYRRANSRVRRSSNFTAILWRGAMVRNGANIHILCDCNSGCLSLSQTESIVIFVFVVNGLILTAWPFLRGLHLAGFLDEDL